MISDLQCSNCNRPLDPTDKFCRECGLPTVHRAEAQRQAAEQPPNVAELKQAMEVAADPTPFGRAGEAAGRGGNTSPELTTSGVIKVTNPTFAAQMAGSTLLMVGIVVVLLVIGVALIVLAVKF